MKIEFTWMEAKGVWFAALFKNDVLVVTSEGFPPLMFADDAESLWELVEKAVGDKWF